MTAAPRERMTFKEYVAFEERSELRHEFYDGEVFRERVYRVPSIMSRKGPAPISDVPPSTSSVEPVT